MFVVAVLCVALVIYHLWWDVIFTSSVCERGQARAHFDQTECRKALHTTIDHGAWNELRPWQWRICDSQTTALWRTFCGQDWAGETTRSPGEIVTLIRRLPTRWLLFAGDSNMQRQIQPTLLFC